MKYSYLLLTALLGTGSAFYGCSAQGDLSPIQGSTQVAGIVQNVGAGPQVTTHKLALVDNGLNELAFYPRLGADVSFGSPTVIVGSNTELSTPFGVGTNGKIMAVGNVGHSFRLIGPRPFANSTIHLLVFKTATSGGNISPTKEITGSKTLLQAPEGVVVDAAGEIFVADSTASAVFKFAAGAKGNVAPTEVISGVNTTLRNPTRIALDSAGNIWVSNGGASSILEFQAGVSGDVAPLVTISGSNTQLGGVAGIAVSKSGEIFATNYISNEVLEFAPGSNGNVLPAGIISGSATQLNYPTGVTIDAGDKQILVASHFMNQVNSYKMTASGNVAPLSVLSDAGTQGVLDVSFH